MARAVHLLVVRSPVADGLEELLMPRPVRPWFRFYVEAFNDRKIRRLTPTQRWIWASVLGAARESPESGRLFIAEGVPMTRKELADYAGVKLREIEPALTAMADLSMVSIDANGLVSVTNWDSRQFESDDVTQRTRDHRERSREQGRNVPKNVPGNTPETETETETERTNGQAAPDDGFDQFWAVYPRKVSKGQARRAWNAAAKKAAPAEIVNAVESFGSRVANSDPKFIPHPATWLNGERWSDEPDGQTNGIVNGRLILPPLPSRSPWDQR